MPERRRVLPVPCSWILVFVLIAAACDPLVSETATIPSECSVPAPMRTCGGLRRRRRHRPCPGGGAVRAVRPPRCRYG
ncbi:hypothetical protein ACIBFB_08005 [Nocardiopsis sp. NPDC050513]|uniref:hypothetical protein n=1 Tax=Nocardiopsis sp. NPDC050513 TaxID=3364338 RepID=UPI00379E6692